MLTVFSIRRRVFESALEGVTLCLFGAFYTMEKGSRQAGPRKDS